MQLLGRSGLALAFLFALALLAAGCEAEEPAVQEDLCPPFSTLDWENAGQPYLLTWCTPCHSSHLSTEDRAGAPSGINFDSYDGLSGQLENVIGYVEGDDPLMPPEGGPPEADNAAFLEWLRCGAPQ